MQPPLTNIHTHVFNTECAPDRFLRILPVKFVRNNATGLKKFIDGTIGRSLIKGLSKIYSIIDKNKQTEIDKMVSFLEVGTGISQYEVFAKAFKTGRLYDSSVRIIGLTLNMDHMDSQSSSKQKNFVTQLQEVRDIKRYHPANFFPFLCIDPRHHSGKNLVDFVRPYFETGVACNGIIYPYFSGIKLYPALGFFPFDERLHELYIYAQKNNLPVMTHCTRVGSQYIGDQIEALIPDMPRSIPLLKDGQTAYGRIVKRIAAYRAAGWIKNSRNGANDLACDLFGHPDNYIPLLETYPSLRICLAHLGGSSEMKTEPTAQVKEIRNKGNDSSWSDQIISLMAIYKNLYTDISYTVSALGDQEVLAKLNTLLSSTDAERVLFGTDFFMTEQEMHEASLYELAKTKLADHFENITRINTQRYLQQPY
jgi:predicted TIM-barrel fold metal-dependent hydrolase